MIINTKVMFSSNTDLWETPQDFFDHLNDEFCFDIDVCATDDNAKCDTYFTKEQDGLSQSWGGLVGVILRMAVKSANGCKKHMSLAKKKGLPLLCCYQQELTPDGFMNTYIINQKLDLSKDD